MRLLKAFLLLLVIVGVGCQKKESKMTARCVYDQETFSSLYREAVEDETAFAHFKQQPFLNLLWENRTFEEGELSLKRMGDTSLLKAHLEAFRQNDAIGNPRVYDFKEFGHFSPMTLHYVELAAIVNEKAPKRVVQIGAGYGGLCYALHQLSDFESYTIVDLPEFLPLAEKYLNAQGVLGVIFTTPDAFFTDSTIDFVISDFNFSEYQCKLQQLFIDRILTPSQNGYLLGHVFPKHFGVVSYSPKKLVEELEKRGKMVKMESDDPLEDRANYILMWKTL